MDSFIISKTNGFMQAVINLKPIEVPLEELRPGFIQPTVTPAPVPEVPMHLRMHTAPIPTCGSSIMVHPELLEIPV